MDQATEKLDLPALRKKAEGSLYFFTKGILGYDWLVPHIHMQVCDELQDPSSTKKLIELPRGWLKSTIGSIAFPMWLSIKRPNIRCLLVQNSFENACRKLSVIAKQWEGNPILRAMYPELLPGKNSTWKADALCLTRSASFPESTYEAAGTSTRVVSRHYDVIIEDDTVAPDYDELGDESLAPTHDDVQKAIGWHRTNSLPLLNNPNTDTVLVIGTRWYDQDLIRWVKDNEKHYKIISRAVREDSEGKPDPQGRITYPERFNAETLESLAQALGPYMFNCLYLNQPVRADDMLFKGSWFQFYDVVPPPDHLAVYTTIDVATDPELSLSTSKDVDYNVVMTCAKDLFTGYIYILDYTRFRGSPGDLISAVFDHVVKWKPIKVGYENVGYQKSLDYWLKELMRQENKFFLLEQIPRRGKDAKKMSISALQPIFQAGAILMRTWMKDLQSELLSFPLGSHDDIADALSMHLYLWKGTRTKEQQRRYLNHGGDPLSLDSALAELERRRKGGLVGPVFDPMRTDSLRTGPYAFPRARA